MGISYAAELYRKRASECFQRAQTARDTWTKNALESLCDEMLEDARRLESTTSVAASGPGSRRG